MGILATSASADDFVIDQPVNQTNGGFPIDDDDTLTVEATGAINTIGDGEDGIFAGSRNTLTNFGSITTNGLSQLALKLLTVMSSSITVALLWKGRVPTAS